VAFEDEAEPNNEPAAAGTLAVPGGVKGTLDGPSDVDVYAVKVPAQGVLSARLSGIAGVDLVLELQDATGELLAHSDRAPANEIEGIPNFAVDPGDYYLVVSEYVHKRRKGGPRTGPSPVYALTVAVDDEPAEHFEREPNETPEGAGELVVDTEERGYLGWRDDVDVWRVVPAAAADDAEAGEGAAPGNAPWVPVAQASPGGAPPDAADAGVGPQHALALEVVGVPWVTPKLELLDDDGAVLLARDGAQGKGITVTNVALPPAGTGYQVRLSGKRSNPVEPYRILVSRRLVNPGGEIEPDDTAEHAISLVAPGSEEGGTRRGVLDRGDTDAYRLGDAHPRQLLNVSVAPTASANVAVEVLSGGASLARADGGGRGAREQLTAVAVPALQDVIITVTGGPGSEPGPYVLRWSVLPADDAPPAAPVE
jgi:hypothetical protein